jgi:regulator of sigma E protease
MTLGMKFNQEAKSYGFKDGDILVGTDKRTFKEFSANLYRDISEAKRVDIIRNGKPLSINLPGELNMLNMLKAEPAFVRPLMPAVVDSILPGSPAAKIGMKKGDKILAINDSPIDSYNEFIDQLGRRQDLLLTSKTAADSLKARTVVIAFGNDARTDTTAVMLTPDLKLGFTIQSLASLYKPVTREYGFFESFPAGVKYGWSVLASYVDDLKYVFTAEGAKSLGGFGTIGNLFPADWDWYVFWKMTAFLSIILAFMNILPIPALDGGHVLFLLYEMITRRKPSEEFMIRAEYVGFGIVLLLLVVANLNDILRSLGIM